MTTTITLTISDTNRARIIDALGRQEGIRNASDDDIKAWVKARFADIVQRDELKTARDTVVRDEDVVTT